MLILFRALTLLGVVGPFLMIRLERPDFSLYLIEHLRIVHP